MAIYFSTTVCMYYGGPFWVERFRWSQDNQMSGGIERGWQYEAADRNVGGGGLSREACGSCLYG